MLFVIYIAGREVRVGLLTLSVPHASCSRH